MTRERCDAPRPTASSLTTSLPREPDRVLRGESGAPPREGYPAHRRSSPNNRDGTGDGGTGWSNLVLSQSTTKHGLLPRRREYLPERGQGVGDESHQDMAAVAVGLLALTAVPEAFATIRPPSVARADVCVNAGRRVSVSGAPTSPTRSPPTLRRPPPTPRCRRTTLRLPRRHVSTCAPMSAGA